MGALARGGQKYTFIYCVAWGLPPCVVDVDKAPPDPDLSQLRVIFVSARARSGLTFEELAERSGLHRQTLTNIARGRAYGDLRTWLLLARAFEMQLDDLLEPVWEGRHAATRSESSRPSHGGAA